MSCVAFFCRAAAAQTPDLMHTEAAAATAIHAASSQIESRTLADCSSTSRSSHGPHTVTTLRKVVVKLEGSRITAIATSESRQPGHPPRPLTSTFNLRPLERSFPEQLDYVDVETEGRKFTIKVFLPPGAKTATLDIVQEGQEDSETWPLTCR